MKHLPPRTLDKKWEYNEPHILTGSLAGKDDKIADKDKVMANIKQRKNYQLDFKAKVVLEAVKGRLTINGISK